MVAQTKDASLSSVLSDVALLPARGLNMGLNKFVDLLGKYPKLEELTRKATSYRFMDPANATKNILGGSALGSGVGGAAGFLSGLPQALIGEKDKNKKKLSLKQRLAELAKRTAIGAGVGAVAGAGAGKWGPRAIQKSMGRVFTNVIDPYGYNLKQQITGVADSGGPVEALKAVIKDEQLPYITDDSGFDDEVATSMKARSILFRDFFGLPARPSDTPSIFREVGKDRGGKVYEFNQSDPMGDLSTKMVDKYRVNSLIDGSGYPMMIGKSSPSHNTIFHNFNIAPDGQYSDVWDVEPNPGEGLKSKTNLFRALVSMFGTPSKIVGKTFNEGESMERFPLGVDRINPDIIKSITGGKGLSETIAENTGLAPGLVNEYLATLPDVEQEKVKKQLSNLLNKRPANWANISFGAGAGQISSNQDSNGPSQVPSQTGIGINGVPYFLPYYKG